MARNTDIRGRLKKSLSDDMSDVDERLDAEPDHSYPIYILDLGMYGTTAPYQKEFEIVFPEGKVDLDHSIFWEQTVAKIVAKQRRLPLEGLLNLPYCQRRARIYHKNVLYGEKTSKGLLQLIEKAVGVKGMRFVYDDHEKRLEYDVADFLSLESI